MICSNRHKYPVSANHFMHRVTVGAMCDVLGLPRSSFYYYPIEKVVKNELNQAIQSIFIKSRNNYEIRKIEVELKKQGYSVSRRRIGRIMNEGGLVST